MITLWQVGGSVRDEILGLKSKDLDYAVEASSYEEMRDFINRNGNIFLETPEFFTIRALIPELGAADFVWCRRDGNYSDGRRPDIVYPGTILDDLSRRDFTMNAIAKNVKTCEYFDPFNGRKDIREKTIRCVGLAEHRFREDSLRMLRALRFSITKNMSLDSDIRHCLKKRSMVNLLENVSVERIREELYIMFRTDTYRTWNILNTFHMVRDWILSHTDIWFIPTLKEK